MTVSAKTLTESISNYVTACQIAVISQQPPHRARRLARELGLAYVEVFGRKLYDRRLLPLIAAEIRRRDWDKPGVRRGRKSLAWHASKQAEANA